MLRALARRRPRHAWMGEISLFALALLVYQASRSLVIGSPATAFENARALIAFEKQAGLFVMRGLTPEDTRRAIGTICPNVLFPYARVAVSQLVTQGGFPNFVLPPVDFDQLFARGAAQAQANANPGQAN